MKRFTLIVALLICSLSVTASGGRLALEKSKLISKKPHIDSILFSGNRSFSRGELLGQMSCREDGFWQSIGLMGDNQLTKAKLRSDQAVLDYFYRSRGFTDAVTIVDFHGDLEKRAAVVTVDIQEGPRYRVGKVTIGGDLGQLGWQVTLASRRFKVGEYLNFYDIELVRQDIKTVFANNGYPYAQIDISLDRKPDEELIEIAVQVTRGKVVLFGDVIVDSSKFQSPKVSNRIFEKEIAFKRGELYSRDKFVLSQQRLIRTNLFRYVALKTPGNMSQLDSLMPSFIVTGVPRPPKYINLSAGAAQHPEKDLVWDLVATTGNRNLNGSGRKVQFESSTSHEVEGGTTKLIRAVFQFSYVEPYLFGIRMPLISELSFEPGLKDVIHDYRIETIKLETTAIREFSLITRLSISGSYEQYNIYGVDDPQKFKDEQGISVNRRLSFLLERDTRPLESKFNPWLGSFTQYRLDYVGGLLGGDDDFVKAQFNWAKYNLISSRAVIASRLRLGWVSAFGKSSFVPSRDRFFLGGAFTVRGFRENSIFPVDSQGREGGETILLMNLELRSALIWKFWGSLFSDAGLNAPSLDLVRWDQFVFSAGAGLQFMSPVGPIRVDYGQRVPVHGVDPGGRLHLSILYAF